MKKIIINVFTVVIFILGITSCSDFLKEIPKNQISVDQYFKIPADARSIVNTLYSEGVPTFYNSGDWEGTPMMLDGYMSGLFDNARKERLGPTEAQNLTLSPTILQDYMFSLWSTCYNAISQSNNALKYIPGIVGLSQSESSKLLAEARFFRALNYFYMVKHFGDVPLITKPYGSLDSINVERDADKKVYDQITTDLEWALNDGGLVDVPFYMNGFRITKGAVATLLADVYLQMAGYPVQSEGAYSKAAKFARIVINSGQYKLISNGATPKESAYNVMRTSNTEREYIYSYECDPQLRTNNSPKYCVPMEHKPPFCIYESPWNAYRPLNEFVRIYNPDVDLRIQNSQLWHNKIIRNGVTYDFNGDWAAYLWYDEKAIYETGRGSMNINIYGYAEVLLIAAEAIARSEGVTPEAVSYLTDVRSRAYWETDRDQIKSELEGLSVDLFIKEVWKERLRELPFYFKTWPDIQRTRLYPVTNPNNSGEVNFENVVGHTNPWGATFKEYHLLFPISKITLQRNPNIIEDSYPN